MSVSRGIQIDPGSMPGGIFDSGWTSTMAKLGWLVRRFGMAGARTAGDRQRNRFEGNGSGGDKLSADLFHQFDIAARRFEQVRKVEDRQR